VRSEGGRDVRWNDAIRSYGFPQPQPSHSLQGNSKRVPYKPQSHLGDVHELARQKSPEAITTLTDLDAPPNVGYWG
jgi:hypothetical protein